MRKHAPRLYKEFPLIKKAREDSLDGTEREKIDLALLPSRNQLQTIGLVTFGSSVMPRLKEQVI